MVEFRKRTIREIADMICGNESNCFKYRSSSRLSEFFEDCDMEQYVHGGSTRKWWVASVLEEVLAQPADNPALPSRGFQTVIQVLMDVADATDVDPHREVALAELNTTMVREGLEVFYADDKRCYIRNTMTGATGTPSPETDRALSKEEIERHQRLEKFIDGASEDALTEKIVVPLLQTLRFQKISIAGHRDRAMEFGKDIWMKYCLPTGHWLYFGLQVKRGKIDAAAKSNNKNIAEVYNQSMMMLGHEIFDPDINKKVLVDHAIILAGGEITKQAKHWLGERLDASRRRQILFMDRAEILHLCVIHNVPMPDDKDQRFDQ